MQKKDTALKYRAEIDGLRAVAVVPVVLFHAGFTAFSGGFAGVDIFFVISGYLITTILIDDLENKRFSLLHFYERRARRILPALTCVVTFCVIAAWVLMSPPDLKTFGRGLIGVAVFASNIVFWRSQGYFSDDSDLNPLIHTWSLAVEEQYYVFFPLFLMLAWRLGRNKVFWLIVLFSAMSLGLSEWGWRNQASANFFLAPTRAWELFTGSICAFILQNREVKPHNGLSLLGIAAIVFAIFAYDESTPFPSLYTLVPIIGVVLVILFAGNGTITAKALSTKPCVGIGLISYSAYLWHQPIFAFTRLHQKSIDLPLLQVSFLILLSFGLAYLSWRYIEKPFRNPRFLTRSFILSLSAIILFFMAVIGHFSKRVSPNYEDFLAQKLSTADYVYFSNLDERKFIQGRLSYPMRPIDTLVMGSSRVMQIGTQATGSKTLNLSVSGASVEDYIALVGEATAKLKPSHVMLGADPWLFNQHDGQNRWHSIQSLYDHWEFVLSQPPEKAHNLRPFLDSQLSKEPQTPIERLYQALNDNQDLVAKHNGIEAIAKKAYDGLHIYNKDYNSLSEAQIAAGFKGILRYSMAKYTFDQSAFDHYVSLIHWLTQNGIRVSLVLSPYHPDLYRSMVKDYPVFLEQEARFRKIARDLNLRSLGSYDPRIAGCDEHDFFDGMHPKDPCMEKISRHTNE
ncbi:MAG: acyltransferase family protein [Halocynthiibacter sp.]